MKLINQTVTLSNVKINNKLNMVTGVVSWTHFTIHGERRDIVLPVRFTKVSGQKVAHLAGTKKQRKIIIKRLDYRMSMKPIKKGIHTAEATIEDFVFYKKPCRFNVDVNIEDFICFAPSLKTKGRVVNE